MAKPIRATPELRGDEANKFLDRMISVERAGMSRVDRKFAKEIAENTKFFESIECVQLA